MRRLMILLGAALLFSCGTALAGTWGYGGERPIVPADHIQHPKDNTMYTEQWSATIVLAPGRDLNITLAHSNMTTSGKKAVFRVEYSAPGAKKIKEEDRCTIKSQAEPLRITCGKGTIEGPLANLHIAFAGKKLPLDVQMQALAPAFRPKDGRLHDPKDAKDFYDFMLMIPRGKASVKIGDITLSGYGSLDHSYTNTGFHKVSRHWLRTTYHDDEVSILFAANQLPDGTTAGWMSVADNNGKFYSSAEVTTVLGAPLADTKKSGYKTFQSVQMTSTKGDGATLNASGLAQQSRQDMLADLNAFEAFIVRRISDPMRYSMRGPVSITWPGNSIKREVVLLVKQMNP